MIAYISRVYVDELCSRGGNCLVKKVIDWPCCDNTSTILVLDVSIWISNGMVKSSNYKMGVVDMMSLSFWNATLASIVQVKASLHERFVSWAIRDAWLSMEHGSDQSRIAETLEGSTDMPWPKPGGQSIKFRCCRICISVVSQIDNGIATGKKQCKDARDGCSKHGYKLGFCQRRPRWSVVGHLWRRHS